MAVWIQYIIPKRALTERLGRLAQARGGRWTTAAIRWFIRRYGVDMSEAADPDPRAYDTFNAFFTRPLRLGARPLGNSTWVSPVDGAISQLGRLENGKLVQAKGRSYAAQALLGGSADDASPYLGGHFATLYLSPKDYHRIHMPCAGELKRMVYVPGDLFSVNPATAAAVAGLFARNERVVCEFETESGPMAMVLVGATIVGSVQTVWHGVVNPPRRPEIHRWEYAKGEVLLARGDEMGRFMLGSTVVMLWGPGALSFEAGWVPRAPIRMGQNMAHAR